MKRRFILSAFALVLSICISPSAHGEESRQSTETEKIDNEINELTTSLNQFRKDAINKEVKSQPLLFDNWEQFAKGIEDTEEDEKQILLIKKQIESLQQKKKALIQHESPK